MKSANCYIGSTHYYADDEAVFPCDCLVQLCLINYNLPLIL